MLAQKKSGYGFCITIAFLLGMAALVIALTGCGPHIQENSKAVVTKDVTVHDVIGGTYRCSLNKDDIVSIGSIVFRGSDSFGVNAAQISHGNCHGELAVDVLKPLP